jgi:hypothetical protein
MIYDAFKAELEKIAADLETPNEEETPAKEKGEGEAASPKLEALKKKKKLMLLLRRKRQLSPLKDKARDEPEKEEKEEERENSINDETEKEAMIKRIRAGHRPNPIMGLRVAHKFQTPTSWTLGKGKKKKLRLPGSRK